MSKFKVGDRVACYTDTGRMVLKLSYISDDGNLCFWANENPGYLSYTFHPKQCRRIKKITHAKAFLAIGSASEKIYAATIIETKPTMLPPCSNQDLPVWVEFIEVKKK